MRVILSAQDNQHQILQDIVTLHNGGRPFHVDLTYGSGGFWTGEAEGLKPSVRMDLEPRWKPMKVAARNGVVVESTEVNLQADGRALPFRLGSVQSIVFDPPFMHAHGEGKTGEDGSVGHASVMGQRFGSYKSQIALRQMYWAAGMEIQRALAPGGLLVFKCMDIIESGIPNWTHVSTITNYQLMGMALIDMFVLTRKSVMVGANHARQQHSRKNFSYFLVFRKGGKSRI